MSGSSVGVVSIAATRRAPRTAMDPISLEDLVLLEVPTRVSQHATLTSDDSVVRDGMIESGLVIEDKEELATNHHPPAGSSL
jgi:hypothetical protein